MDKNGQKKINCTPEELRDLFITQNKSYRELALMFNCSKDYVKATLRKYGIKKDLNNTGKGRIPDIPTPLPLKGNPFTSVVSYSTVESGESGESGIYFIPPVPVKTEKEVFQDILAERKGDVRLAMFDYCFYKNVFYDDIVVKGIIDKNQDAIIAQLPDYYILIIQQTPKYKDLTFRDQIKIDNFTTIYSEELNLLALSEDDKKNRQQVITILGYDPFKDDADDERPQMYRDLTGLVTENLRKDIAKQKAAIEIVRNYATLGRYQKQVSLLYKKKVTPDIIDQINNLMEMISKIQHNINSTTKENGFTAGKTVGSNGRGMLSDVMNQVELGYDDGITNYYDQATSKSIEEVSNISFKALMNQVRLSGTDYADILQQQTTIIKEAQDRARKAEEACRLAKSKITKQKLLDELADEYRVKNIDEKEIQEFIDREYHFFDVGEKK